jgi:YesN/AraC family two-component response regulator
MLKQHQPAKIEVGRKSASEGVRLMPGRIKVLVVDDEKEIADYIASLLKENFSLEAEVSVLYSGTKAMESIMEGECDLLVADIRMPVTDGLALLGCIADNGLPVEIVFLTAFRDFDYIYNALRRKPITYLMKTESEDVLLAAIREKLEPLLSRAASAAGGTLSEEGEVEVSRPEAMFMIRKYISENIETDISLATLADRFHYNACYLSRAFSKVCGQKLNDCIQECKVASAKKYLLETNFHVSEIAAKLGYQSPQTFIRFFHREVGMSADKWRRIESGKKST